MSVMMAGRGRFRRGVTFDRSENGGFSLRGRRIGSGGHMSIIVFQLNGRSTAVLDVNGIGGIAWSRMKISWEVAVLSHGSRVHVRLA